MGLEGAKVSTEAELQEALTQYLRDDMLAVIDVMVDSRENAELNPR